MKLALFSAFASGCGFIGFVNALAHGEAAFALWNLAFAALNGWLATRPLRRAA